MLVMMAFGICTLHNLSTTVALCDTTYPRVTLLNFVAPDLELSDLRRRHLLDSMHGRLILVLSMPLPIGQTGPIKSKELCGLYGRTTQPLYLRQQGNG